MKRVAFLYGKEKIEYDFDESELAAVLTSSVEEYKPELSEDELVLLAMNNPIGTEPLSELAVGKKRS